MSATEMVSVQRDAELNWMLTPWLSVPLAVVDPWGGHG